MILIVCSSLPLVVNNFHHPFVPGVQSPSWDGTPRKGVEAVNGRSPGSNRWRYVNVPYVWHCLAIFLGDILLHSPILYSLIYGRYLHFRILKFPLNQAVILFSFVTIVLSLSLIVAKPNNFASENRPRPTRSI